MSVTTEKTVGELALENPGATRVFEKLGIDYCCGGGQTLEQACQAAHVSISQVADSLRRRAARVRRPRRPGTGKPSLFPSCWRTSRARTTFIRARKSPVWARCSTRCARCTAGIIPNCFACARSSAASPKS